MKANAIPSHGQTHGALEDGRIPVRLKVSALWATVMFLYVYVDILAFFKPGTIDDILVGRVWEFDISQGWVLGSLALMTVPALMVFLSLVLPAGMARWTNVVVASLYVPVSIFNTVGETWIYYYWFGALLEAGLLLLVVRYAWSWPRVAEFPTRATEARVIAPQR
jgi:hypothetical protein